MASNITVMEVVCNQLLGDSDSDPNFECARLRYESDVSCTEANSVEVDIGVGATANIDLEGVAAADVVMIDADGPVQIDINASGNSLTIESYVLVCDDGVTGIAITEPGVAERAVRTFTTGT